MGQTASIHAGPRTVNFAQAEGLSLPAYIIGACRVADWGCIWKVIGSNVEIEKLHKIYF